MNSVVLFHVLLNINDKCLQPTCPAHILCVSTLCFSDAFDMEFGVCLLRMRDKLDVSNPYEAHGENVDGAVCPSSITDHRSTHVSVNPGFDGGPARVNTTSTLSGVQTISTCMHMTVLYVYVKIEPSQVIDE